MAQRPTAPFLALACFAIAVPAPAAEPEPKQEALVDLIETASEAVCRIVVSDKHGVPLSQGTGFLLDSGHLISCHHVLCTPGAAGAAAVFEGGRSVRVTGALAVDGDRDLVVAKLEASPPGVAGLALARHQIPKSGMSVAAIGYPLGLAQTVSRGIVTSLPTGADIKRSLSWQRLPDTDRLIQTDAAVYPGNSGGPLLGSDGKVLAVISSKHPEGESLSWGVPYVYLRRLLEEVSEKPRSLSELASGQAGRGQPRFILPPRGRRVTLITIRRHIGRLVRMTNCRRCNGTGTVTVNRVREKREYKGVTTREAGPPEDEPCPDCGGLGFIGKPGMYDVAADFAGELAYLRTDATTIRPIEIDRLFEAAGEAIGRLTHFEMPLRERNASARKLAAAERHAGRGVCFDGEVLTVVSHGANDYFLVRVQGAHNVFAALVCQRGAVTMRGECFVVGVVGGQFKGSSYPDVAFIWPVYVYCYPRPEPPPPPPR